MVNHTTKNTMPFPKISPNETQEEFVQRCMADDTMIQEYPNEQQRLAICYLQGKNGKKQEENRNAQKSTGTHKKNAV
jgi:hypothetical protein